MRVYGKLAFSEGPLGKIPGESSGLRSLLNLILVMCLLRGHTWSLQRVVDIGIELVFLSKKLGIGSLYI